MEKSLTKGDKLMAKKPLLFKDVDRETLTPMMLQYVEQKDKRPDCMLLLRLGDFYELFFDDAIEASKILGLTLTERDCGQRRKAPMCGVPHHASSSYIQRLVEAGKKVAICEQLEDPAEAKGLVKRDVIRVVTPGTITDLESLDTLKYHYIASVFAEDDYYGLAFADLSASLFKATEIIHGLRTDKLISELERIAPAEIVCNGEFSKTKACKDFVSEHEISLSLQDDDAFSPLLNEKYEGLCSDPNTLWARASFGLFQYIEASAFRLPEKMPAIIPYRVETYMILNQTARRHLELVESIHDRQRKGSLLWAIDQCKTGMGSRLLRRWLDQPLLDIKEINWRLDCIDALKKNFIERNEIRDAMNGLYDLERLAGKVALQTANPRDLSSIVLILSRIPVLQEQLRKINSPALSRIEEGLDPLDELCTYLKDQLNDEVPVSITEGGIFRDGADSDLDDYRLASRDGKNWLLRFEEREQTRTGIRSLKLKYNRSFGYSIEITHANKHLVPAHYIRQQTLTSSERYITDDLKQMENKILGAEQRAVNLETELFIRLREKVSESLEAMRKNAELLSYCDVLSSYADLASRREYVRPVLKEDAVLNIVGGRHPVVETSMKSGEFVANDLKLDADSNNRLMIITGPNMAGKSTYMRQAALICIMAQAGLFVPATEAEIGICDQIFTRVGASDDLASGRSTFMVEMTEVAQIMKEASRRSLLILDEIGRGTSTWDGVSIAWSVIEHVADKAYIGCRCLFATHYHELTDLEDTVPGVVNAHVQVKREGDEILFLHSIHPGGSDNSYGIEVAGLAGVPKTVLRRATEILAMLVKENNGKRLRIKKMNQPIEGQIDLFTAAREWQQNDEILEEILALDINSMRPLDALSALSDFQNKIRKIIPERRQNEMRNS